MQGVGKKFVASIAALALCAAMAPCALPVSASAETENASSYSLFDGAMNIELNESDHSAVMTLNNDVDIEGMAGMDSFKYLTFSNELSAQGGSADSLASVTSLTIQGSGHYEISNEFRYWEGLKTLDASGAPNMSFATSSYDGRNPVLKALDVLKLPSGVPVSLDWWSHTAQGDVLDLTGWEFTDLDGPDTDFGFETLRLPSSLKSIHEDEVGTASGVFGYGEFLKHIVLAPGTQLESIGDNVFRSSNTIVEDLTMPYMDDFEISADSHISTLDSITVTCAPSSDAEIACLKEALGEDRYASTVTNQLHNLTYDNLSTLSGSGTCELCGETLSSEITSLDEGSEQYKTLAETANGRTVLAAAGVKSNVVDYTFQNSKDASFFWDVTGLDGYRKADVKLLLLNADGTVTEKDVNSLNAGEALCASSEIPAAYMVITAEVPAQQVTVTFDVKGGSTVDSQTVDAGGTISQPADPTRDGYTFAGWFTDESCTQAFDFNTPISEDTTLYAGWEPVTTPVDPGDDNTDDPNDPSGDPNDNADNRQNAGTDDTNKNKSTTNTNAKKASATASSTGPKTGDTAAAAGVGLAGLVALAALGGTLAYRRRKEN